MSRADDRHEREATRAADVVARGGSVASWSFAAVPAEAPVQRQETDKPKTEDEKYKEAMKKAGEAALETKEGQALKEKVLADPLVKPVVEKVTSTPGLIATGAAFAGGVVALGAAGKELPIQPPEIPGEKIHPKLAGISAKITWEGPVFAPTSAGLMITVKEQGPKKKGSAPDPIAADTARLKAQEEMFRKGRTYAPGSKEAEDERLLDEAVQKYVLSRSTLPGFTIPLTPAAPAKKEEEQAPAQPAPATPSADTPAYARVDGALATGGRPLDGRTRRTMEARFGYDFSAVRIHDDARAAATAAGIEAAAFTVGEDVAFGAGRFDPASSDGERLLAHELTHVVQQQGRARSQRKAEPAISAPSDPAEREADAVAERVVAGLAVPDAGSASTAAPVQRQEDGAGAVEEELEWPELDDEQGPEVQASRPSGPAVAPAGFASALAASGGGAPLPAKPRDALEQSFGASFAHVRVHRGGSSDRLASSIGAEAFTTGSDVHFAADAPEPATPAGLALLAHELTHVRQQARSRPGRGVVQRSRALYFSTLGKQKYFEFAGPFHKDRGFPEPVRVSSVEEMLEHLVTLSKPIESVRLVTHAVPAAVMLPLLRGGKQSLFPADLALQTQESLEGELVTEHQTNVKTFAVTEQAFHVVPQDWVASAYGRLTADKATQQFLKARRFPDAVTAGGDLESLIWWVLDREAVLAERERPAGKGKTKKQPVVGGIPAKARPAIAQSLGRNAAIYQERTRDHLVLRDQTKDTIEQKRVRAAQGAAEFVDRLRAVIPALLDERAPGERFNFGKPTQRYGTVQEALERGTYANNLLFAKVAIPNGMPFEIRGCRIGQNPAWLEQFRDFWGLGAGPTRRRPDVSAPDLRHAFGKRKKKTAEWLQKAKGGVILGDTPEFDSHIVHR